MSLEVVIVHGPNHGTGSAQFLQVGKLAGDTGDVIVTEPNFVVVGIGSVVIFIVVRVPFVVGRSILEELANLVVDQDALFVRDKACRTHALGWVPNLDLVPAFERPGSTVERNTHDHFVQRCAMCQIVLHRVVDVVVEQIGFGFTGSRIKRGVVAKFVVPTAMVVISHNIHEIEQLVQFLQVVGLVDLVVPWGHGSRKHVAVRLEGGLQFANQQQEVVAIDARITKSTAGVFPIQIESIKVVLLQEFDHTIDKCLSISGIASHVRVLLRSFVPSTHRDEGGQFGILLSKIVETLVATFVPWFLVVVLVWIEHLDGVLVLVNLSEAVHDVSTLERIDIFNLEGISLMVDRPRSNVAHNSLGILRIVL